MPLSRRRFLKAILFGFVLFLLPLGIFRRFFRAGAPAIRLKSLRDTEAAVLTKAWRALVPEKERKRFQGGETGWLAEADGLVWKQPPYLRKDFSLAISVLCLLPLTRFTFKPFQELSDEQARKLMVSLAQSRQPAFRMVEEAVRQLVYFVFYTNPGTWKQIGYEGPWVGRP